MIAACSDDIRKVYHMLEDEESRFIYRNRLDYLRTGDMEYITGIVHRCLPDVPVHDKTKCLSGLSGSLPEGRRIVLYGAGKDAELVFPYLRGNDRFLGFCDRDRKKQASGLNGFPVISPDALSGMDDICVVVCSRRYGREIRTQLEAYGINGNYISDIREYLTTCTGNTYFSESFIRFSDQEVFIDAGCEDLDSTVRLAGLCPMLKKVYAFEPDPDNFRKCLDRWRRERGRLPEIKLYPQGVWSGRAQLRFAALAHCGSHVTEKGSAVIDAVSIDEVVGDSDTVTFIKMDIEGAELEALKGAAGVIRRDRPKCAICIYHRPEDIVTIPLYIRQLVPEYRLYVRHYSNSEYETVLYAVP